MEGSFVPRAASRSSTGQVGHMLGGVLGVDEELSKDLGSTLCPRSSAAIGTQSPSTNPELSVPLAQSRNLLERRRGHLTRRRNGHPGWRRSRETCSESCLVPRPRCRRSGLEVLSYSLRHTVSGGSRADRDPLVTRRPNVRDQGSAVLPSGRLRPKRNLAHSCAFLRVRMRVEAITRYCRNCRARFSSRYDYLVHPFHERLPRGESPPGQFKLC